MSRRLRAQWDVPPPVPPPPPQPSGSGGRQLGASGAPTSSAVTAASSVATAGPTTGAGAGRSAPAPAASDTSIDGSRQHSTGLLSGDASRRAASGVQPQPARNAPLLPRPLRGAAAQSAPATSRWSQDGGHQMPPDPTEGAAGAASAPKRRRLAARWDLGPGQPSPSASPIAMAAAHGAGAALPATATPPPFTSSGLAGGLGAGMGSFGGSGDPMRTTRSFGLGTLGPFDVGRSTSRLRRKENAQNRRLRDRARSKTTAASERKAKGKRAAKAEALRRKFPYGNYDAYYGYRIGGGINGATENEVWNDARVDMMPAEWFDGAALLDIGCNAGYITILMAERFNCDVVLGIDIDAHLVAKARRLLQQRARVVKRLQKAGRWRSSTEELSNAAPTAADAADKGVKVATAVEDTASASAETGERSAKRRRTEDDGAPAPNGGGAASTGGSLAEELATAGVVHPAADGTPFPISLPVSHGLDGAIVDDATGGNGAAAGLSGRLRFPDNVAFRREDVLLGDSDEATFDVVTCLSVTKWLHLLHGDDGVRRLFHRIFRMLRPGGVLILEPQPWKSYAKRKNMSPTFAENYASIRIKPDQFPGLLKSAVGFESCTMLGVPKAAKPGFRRPLYAFRKPGGVPGVRGVPVHKARVQAERRASSDAAGGSGAPAAPAVSSG